jgi:hypothetical protein
MLINKFGVLNYSMFLSLPEHVRHRQYIVCDEASEIESELVKRFSRSLNYKLLKRLGYKPTDVPVENYGKFRIWLGELTLKLGNEIEDLKKILGKKKRNTSTADSDVQRFKLFTNLLAQIQTTIETWEECEYVIEFMDNGDFYILSVSDDLTYAILNEKDIDILLI